MSNCYILLNNGDNILLNDGTSQLLLNVCPEIELVTFNGGGSKRKLHLKQIQPVYLSIPMYSGLTAHQKVQFKAKSRLKTQLNTYIVVKSSLIDKVKGIFNIKSGLRDTIKAELMVKGKQNDKKFYELLKLFEALD